MLIGVSQVSFLECSILDYVKLFQVFVCLFLSKNSYWFYTVHYYCVDSVIFHLMNAKRGLLNVSGRGPLSNST